MLSHCPSDIARVSVRAGLAAAIVLTAVAPSRGADTLYWNNSAGGNAWIGTNWTPNDVPDPDDTLIWDNLIAPWIYAVAFNATVDLSQSMRFRKSDVYLDFQAPHTTGDVFVSFGNRFLLSSLKLQPGADTFLPPAGGIF